MSDDGGEMREPLLKQMNHMTPKRNTNLSDQQRVINPFEIKSDPDELNLFPKNIIISSRYTIFNFFPKSLLEQFRRLANVYFLVLGIIAATGAYTSYYETAIEPAGILAPMSIVVMISVIKDGIEDMKRHSADSRINSRPTHKVELDGTITTVQWRDLVVGETVIIYGDDEIPADVVVLACGGVQGQTSYVETAAIDGETNLKLKVPCLFLDQQKKNAGSNSSKSNSKKDDDSSSPAHVNHKVTLSEDKTKVVGLSAFRWDYFHVIFLCFF
jgi:magnesium-transporting ATPase (P-type)